jgi:hypothetical protein
MQHQNILLFNHAIELKRTSTFSFIMLPIILSCLVFLSSCALQTKTTYDHNVSNKKHYYNGKYQGEHNHNR